MNEQKAKCEATEKRESERRQVEEKKHNEEIQFLKRTNQQLKVSPVQARVEGLLPAPSPKLPPLPGPMAPFPAGDSEYLSTCTAKD